jgi:antitoxin ParD1/3/4
MRDLIRGDKKCKAQQRLETLILDGLESGDSNSVTPDFWKEVWARADARKNGMPPGSVS